MNYYEYKPTLERKKELLHILDSLKKDYEKVSIYSQHQIEKVIEKVEKELVLYRKHIFNFDTGIPDVIYTMSYKDYTDDELSSPDKLFEDRVKQKEELMTTMDKNHDRFEWLS